MSNLKKIVKRDEDFAQWYTSIIQNAKLCLYGSVKGTIIFQPNAWFIWERIKFEIEKEFKKHQIQNVSLPLLIPKSEFMKEKEHLEGFAPECFTVTKIGETELSDPYIIRPTSEISFCNYFANIASTYKMLPIKLNQWCSVLRAEKTTRPFLRNSEFHWQELHAIFASKQETVVFTKQIIDIYQKVVNNLLCIPVIKGVKTIGERFAGADETYTIEALMQDGQVLQCGTSHYLAQNFSKIYGIKFQNKDNQYDFVHQMSAGVSTRLLGATIMVHSDDNGLLLPPDVAPIQININVVGHDKNPEILKTAKKIATKLKKYRTKIDDSEHGLGFKLADGEVIGVPIQVIVGNEAVNENRVTLIRRDDRVKQNVNIDQLFGHIDKSIKMLKKAIFEKASEHLNNSIIEIHNIDELKQVISDKKIAKAYWSGTAEDEKKLKELLAVTPRCIINNSAKPGKCFFTDKPSNSIVIFGRAY